METASYFQSAVIFFTPATICLAVNLGPDANFRGSLSPVTRTLTCVPPTSITRTFIKPSRRPPRPVDEARPKCGARSLTVVSFSCRVLQPARGRTRQCCRAHDNVDRDPAHELRETPLAFETLDKRRLLNRPESVYRHTSRHIYTTGCHNLYD